jgi:ABC-type glycerol-3-phosphate transport system permease component
MEAAQAMASAPVTPGRRRTLRWVGRVAAYAGLSLIALAVLYPLFFTANTALKEPQDQASDAFGIAPNPTFDNFSTMWEQANVLTGLRNSLIVAIGVIILLWVCASLAGFAVAKLTFRGRVVFFLIVLASGLIPFQTIVAPIFVEFNRVGLLDQHFGLILVYVAVGMPLTVFLFAAYFRGLPDSAIEAARLDGASTLRILRHVLLPMALPALAITGILNFVIVFNDLLMPVVLLQSPEKQLFVPNVAQVAGRYPAPTLQAAGVLIGFAPLIIAFLFAQRFLIRGVTAGAAR